tara:strand:- start:3568 stop:4062 length:495 start_codon:yes stop_codon:yes gene_type:complete
MIPRLMICSVLLIGCSVPDAIRRLERESVASIEAYHSNAEAAINGLLEAYRDASYREMIAVSELALAEEAETIEVPGEDGPVSRTVMDAATAKTALDLVVQKSQAIETSVDSFRLRWTAAGADYSDALRLREKLKGYLSRGGVEAEDIEGLSEALAKEIERANR